MATKVYKNPNPGKPLISTISSSCKTPTLEVKFCSLYNAFYYDNSKTVPRYSVTCLIDPNENEEFLTGLQTIEKNEGVDSILKNEKTKENEEYVNTGKVLMKFQSRDKIPVYVLDEAGKEHLVSLEGELLAGENVVVVFDIMRYTKKNTMTSEHGISFKPTKIYLFPKEELPPAEEQIEDIGF